MSEEGSVLFNEGKTIYLGDEGGGDASGAYDAGGDYIK